METLDLSAKLYDAPPQALRACAAFERHLRTCDRSGAIKLGQDVADIRHNWIETANQARAAGDADAERKATGTVAAFTDFLDQVRRQIAAPYLARFPETDIPKECF